MNDYPARMPPAPYQWSDAQGTPRPLGCRVKQTAVDPQRGALRDRLYQHDRVIGWDTTWLHVCFDRDRTLVVLAAHLVRVLDLGDSRRPA